MSDAYSTIANYFKKKMPPHIKRAVHKAEWNLIAGGGPISNECRKIRGWLESVSAYYLPQELEDFSWSGDLPLYSRYAKGRERFDAIDFKNDILPRDLRGYV